jgi:hypothetical protein
MIQYIYFVKCPNCEDEHFDFFDEAKAFALGCLSQKPIITQIEVDRNDFGECTDSNDLGTIWSWEDECKECGPDAEKAGSHILTKADLENVPDYDPEFDALDNSVEVEDKDEEFREGIIGRLGSEADEIDLIEFTELCKEIGIETVSDLDRFIKDESNRPGTLLDKLKSYRAELGDDFKITNEELDLTHGYDHIKSVATLVHKAVDNYTKDNRVGTQPSGTAFYVVADKASSDPEKMKKEYAIDMLHYNHEAQRIFVENIDENFLI